MCFSSAWKNHGFRALRPIFRAKWNQLFEPLKPSQLPVILHMETTSRCNLRCPSCIHAEKLGVGTDMDFDMFKTFIDQFEFVAKLILYGIGEPTMLKDLFRMVQYAKSKGIYCGFFTNGTLLTERMREEILSNGQDYLNISIDGPTKESFEVQRAGANFEKVIANVKALTALIRERKSLLQVTIYNCLTSANMHELPALVQLTADLGVSKLVVQDIMFWGSQGIEKAFESKTIDLERTRRNQFYEEARLAAKRLGVNLEAQISAGDGKRRCQLPWFFSYITADGLATPCNWHGWDGKFNFGSTRDRPFADIWDSQDYRAFRQEMKNSVPPAFCEKCPMYDRKMIRLA